LFKSKAEAWDAVLAEVLQEKNLSFLDWAKITSVEQDQLLEEAEKRRLKYSKESFQYKNTVIIGSPEDLTFNQFLKRKGIRSGAAISADQFKDLTTQYNKKHGWTERTFRYTRITPSMAEIIDGRKVYPYAQLTEAPPDLPHNASPEIRQNETIKKILTSSKPKEVIPIKSKVPEIIDVFNRAANKTVSTASTKTGLKLALGVGAGFVGMMATGSVINKVKFGTAGNYLPEPISEEKINGLYGLALPATSEEFFKREDDSEISNFKAQLAGAISAKKGPSIGTRTNGPGKLLPSELKQISGNAAEVDLSKFNYRFLDADTVELTPKGLGNRLFGGREPISIRLSGLDAPEVSHEGRTAMPQAGTATAKLEKTLEDKNLRLVINTDAGAQTKGRYLGLAYTGESSKPLNLKMVEEGLAAALTYNEGLINQNEYKKAERKAFKSNVGIWQLDYYKQYRKERSNRPGRLTFNVLSSAPDADIQQARLRVKSSIYRKDEHLQVEGLDHYNVAQHVRHFNTDFGSSWDIMRSIAKGLYKDADPEDAFRMLKENPAFRASIQEALDTGGSKLGSGLTADVYSHRVSFKHGLADLPEEFDVITKQYTTSRLKQQSVDSMFGSLDLDLQRDLRSSPEKYAGWLKNAESVAEGQAKGVIRQSVAAETEALNKLGGLNAPSLYGKGEDFGFGSNTIIMERFKGKTLEPISEKIPGGFLETRTPLSESEGLDLFNFMKKAHSKDISHTDLHSGNIMRVETPDGPKIGVIDWGMSNRYQGMSKRTYESDFKSIIDEAADREGKRLDVSTFQKTEDIGRVYGHTLEGLGASSAEDVLFKGNLAINLDPKRAQRLNATINQLHDISKDPSRTEQGHAAIQNLIQSVEEGTEFFGGRNTMPPKAYSGEAIPASPAARRRAGLAKKDIDIPDLRRKEDFEFSGTDDAYNAIEGVHPGSAFGSGAINLKKNTDFGSGGRIGLESFVEIKERMQKGMSYFDAYKDFATSRGFKVVETAEEQVAEIERMFQGRVKNATDQQKLDSFIKDLKKQHGLNKPKWIRKLVSDPLKRLAEKATGIPLSKYNTLVLQGTGEVVIFTNRDIGISSHELFEGIVGKQMAVMAPNRREKMMRHRISGHNSMNIIGNEILFTKLAGEKEFEKIKKLREREIKSLKLFGRWKKLSESETSINRKIAHDLMERIDSGKSTDMALVADKIKLDSLEKEYKQSRYLKYIEENYKTAEVDVQEKIKKKRSRSTFRVSTSSDSDAFEITRGLPDKKAEEHARKQREKQERIAAAEQEKAKRKAEQEVRVRENAANRNLREQVRRQTKANQVATSAVGAGHASAHNAGKKHVKFASKSLPKIGFGLLGLAAIGGVYWLTLGRDEPRLPQQQRLFGRDAIADRITQY
jgi:endonuclease YncB( thermonuclease family)/serine/threonine protein kinase